MNQENINGQSHQYMRNTATEKARIRQGITIRVYYPSQEMVLVSNSGRANETTCMIPARLPELPTGTAAEAVYNECVDLFIPDNTDAEAWWKEATARQGNYDLLWFGSRQDQEERFRTGLTVFEKFKATRLFNGTDFVYEDS